MITELDIAICNRCRQVREMGAYSRPQFADIMNESQHYIKNYETHRQSPSNDFLIRLKHRFNLKWEWLMEGTGGMME